MKLSIFAFVFFAATTVHAEQTCHYDYDGKNYRIWDMNSGPISLTSTFRDRVTYSEFNSTTRTFETKTADVDYKVIQVTLAEQRTAACQTPGVGDYDRDVTAVKFEATSTEAVFGSPTDGAPFKTRKQWALCRGTYLRLCP